MEKRMVLAMVLSVGVLFAYSALFAPQRPQQGTGGATTGIVITGTGGSTSTTAPDPADPPPPTDTDERTGDPPPAGVAEYDAAPRFEVETERLTVGYDPARGGGLDRLWVFGAPEGVPRENVAPTDPGEASFPMEGGPLALGIDVGGTSDPLRLARRPWQVEREGDGWIRASMDVEGLRIVRRTRASTDPMRPYHLDVRVSLENPAGTARGSDVVLQIFAPFYAANERMPVPDDGVIVAEATDLDYFSPSEIADKIAEGQGRLTPEGLRFLGMRNAFFLGALRPKEPLPAGTQVQLVAGVRDAEEAEHRRVGGASLLVPLTIPSAGAVNELAFELYAGPNSKEILAADGPYAVYVDAIPHRWLSIGFLEDALYWILTALASTGIGYGWAILGLTLLVRGCMFPLSRKSQISMRVHSRKMALLKPKMDAIREKVKDPKKQQQEIMQLMRKEQVSLLPGGCLLAFVQMPIWISLWGVLQTTFEMRYEGFLWFDDLTAADHFMALPFTEGWPIIDGWLNLLPILMMITWGVSARMQPLPADPQQQQQAKMMRWMPMLFGVMLYSFASGLALYMTLSALWSIGEVTLIRKVWLSKLEPVPTPATPAS